MARESQIFLKHIICLHIYLKKKVKITDFFLVMLFCSFQILSSEYVLPL